MADSAEATSTSTAAAPCAPAPATSTVVDVTSHTGDIIRVDTSRDATESFGFHHGDVVRFMKSRDTGKVARVIGACDGVLWFQFQAASGGGFDDKARATSCRVSAEFIRQYGWAVVSPGEY